MLGCSSTNVERWASRWFWTQRTYAYDLIEEERFREQMSRDRVAMRRRQIQLGVACQSVAAYGVRELQAKVAAGTPLNLAPQEIKDLLTIGSQLEGRGMGDEKSSRYTRINVVMGRHRYAHEPCGCSCTACAGCRGEENEETLDDTPIIDGDELKKLN